MPKPLPPLNALRAFEAAARHRSIRRAALELHVTPAAVSQQVKLLEDFLDVKLFDRVKRGLALTAEAQASVGRLREGFDALASAVELMRTQHRMQSVRVGAAPSFAGKWLAPRVQGYCSVFPDTDVRIAADQRFIDPQQAQGDAGPAASAPGDNEFDIAIRFGRGIYPGWRVDKLFDVVATPLCSPQLMAGPHPLLRPADLRHHTLLHDDTISAEQGGVDWNAWLKAAKVRDVDTLRGAHFNQAVMGLAAAIDGAGVVLSYPLLASSDLAQGRLIAPFDLEVKVDFAYFMLSDESADIAPGVAAFRDWMLETVRAASPH